jgi:ribosomal protein S18 acetylase RimI-like enzyme
MSKTIDNNFNLHACKIPGMTKGMIVTRLPGLTYVDSGLSCDTFNIIHITNGSLLTEQDCLQAVNYFRNKGLAFCIWVSDENLSPNVQAILNSALVKQQNKEPGMALDLSAYSPSPDVFDDNIIIGKTPQAVKDFAEVVACNWSPPDDNVREYFARTAAAYIDAAQEVSLAIYYQDGVPVSVVEVFPSDEEIIGFYALATLSNYRGVGIGSKLMKSVLKMAKEKGFRTAVLQASEDGIGIYRRYGFQVVAQYYEFA